MPWYYNPRNNEYISSRDIITARDNYKRYKHLPRKAFVDMIEPELTGKQKQTLAMKVSELFRNQRRKRFSVIRGPL